ncbi:MAG: hypothetical protein MJE77_03450 [Proteobacteria bacterium]|nr:hypothetical protein [Pseudomonadota bacterium]
MRCIRPRTAGFSVFLVLLVSAACSDDGSDTDPELLFAAGSYEVGYQELELTYRPAAAAEDRTLPVSVWYPAASGSGAPAVEYSVAGVVSVASDRALVEPPVADDGRFPVAIYSHGSRGTAVLGYPYGELFASHGWVFAAPSHIGNTAVDGLQDPFAQILLNRPNDITALIDGLDNGLGRPALGEQSDTSRVFVIGHSLGGYTALASAGADMSLDRLVESCQGVNCDVLADAQVAAAFQAGFGDPRVVAVVPQAPAVTAGFADGEIAALEVAVMLQSGRLDQTTTQAAEAEPTWSALDGPDDLWIDVPMGAHHTFITVCDDLPDTILRAFLPNAYMDGCGPDFIPVAQAVPVLGAYALGFARRHVLGESGWDSELRGPAWRPGFAISVGNE